MTKLLDKLERFQPLVLLAAAALGLLFGMDEGIKHNIGELEDPILMILLFFIFLDTDFHEAGSIIKTYRFTLSALLMNFVWTPIFAIFLAHTILADNYSLQLALIILLVMPCTDWYLVFTGLSGGNVGLSSAILPVNLLFQLILLPVYLSLFFHNTAVYNFFETGLNVLSVVGFPFILAILIRIVLVRNSSLESVNNWLEEHSETIEFCVMVLVVVTIFASEGSGLYENPQIYPMMLLALCIYYPVNFALSFFIGKKTGLKWCDRVSLLFTTTARNSALSLSIAALIFPQMPLVTLALLIGPVTEIPVLAIESWSIRLIHHKKSPEESTESASS